jgi:hypothetical protein
MCDSMNDLCNLLFSEMNLERKYSSMKVILTKSLLIIKFKKRNISI